MILGVDLGSYSVKTSTNISFFSKVTQEEIFTESNKIVFNGAAYNIGQGEFSTDWDKSRKENTLILLYAAIAKSTKDNINQIVIGLPVQQYKNNKDNLTEFIMNNRCGIINKRKIFISDVVVAPEGASAYYAIDKNTREKIGNKQLIIIEIGGRTTDITVLKNGIIIDVKTIPIGMLNIYQEIIDYVNYRHTESFSLNVPPVIGNECGSLAPQRYGGLSYKIVGNKGDIKIIDTKTFGRVQIYAPNDADSDVTNYPRY